MSSALALPQPESAAAGSLAAGRAVIESRLSALLDSGQPATPLRRVPQYAVLAQGQPFRPILALRIARLRGQENFLAPLVMAAAESLSRNRSYARRAAVPQVLCPFAPPLDRFAPCVVRPNITPLEAFYGRSRNTVDPVIDPPNWRLRIALDGQPMKSFTYAELPARLRNRRAATLRCVSNTPNRTSWSPPNGPASSSAS
ncbi:MAG: hypothetical protein M1541_05830 [Acidobacteria bacterium]|nr:hypothetical protein [Acidobacteriota bacterium]